MVDSVSVRFSNASVSKNAFKRNRMQWNRLRVGVRAKNALSGPISRDIAIVSLRYPLSRDTFSAIPAIPQQVAIPPLGALFDTDI